MKTNVFISAFVMPILVAVTSISPAKAGEGIADGNDNSAAAITAPINPSTTWSNSAHVANGVALRNRYSGYIHLRGVPVSSSTVVAKAYLYWNYSDKAATGATNDAALFEGNRVTGLKVADNIDPCWGLTGNHTYRADVTSYVTRSRPNEDYRVTILSATSSSGQNPWNPAETQTRRLEGAALVVVYQSSTTAGKTVSIYDALSGGEFSSSASFTLNNAFTGSGLFTLVGADGQKGAGHDNGASNEKSFFDSVQIAGPPVAASDWDGSTGLPLPQLWDVTTHIVSFTGRPSVVSYTSGSDCLVPVAFVLQKGL